MRSTDPLLPHRDGADEVEIERVTETAIIADGDSSLRRNLDGGMDDVALPITLAGRDVAGQREVRQGGKGDVVGAADSRFQHAAAPNGDACGLRHIVDALRFAEAAYAAQLDINDAAGAQPDSLLGVV